MLMIVKNNFHVKKVACCFLWPVMVSAAFVQPKKPATFTAVPTCESVFSAKIYISVDSGKRISEKYLFEKAYFYVIPCSRCRHGCKNQTSSTKKAWRDELFWQQMRSCLASQSPTPLLVSNSLKISSFFYSFVIQKVTFIRHCCCFNF